MKLGRIIDGKKEYCKTINFGALPSQSQKAVEHGIGDLDKTTDGKILVDTQNGAQYILPLGGGFSSYSIKNIYAYVENTNVVILCNGDEGNSKAIIQLCYTKKGN